MKWVSKLFARATVRGAVKMAVERPLAALVKLLLKR